MRYCCAMSCSMSLQPDARSNQRMQENRVTDSDAPFSDAVIAAVDKGQKINAIKILRGETGLGLKEAKHAVDALALERQKDPAVAARLAEEGGAGGLVKMVLVIAIILVGYFYFFAS